MNKLILMPLSLVLFIISCTNNPNQNEINNIQKADSVVQYMRSTTSPLIRNRMVEDLKHVLDSLQPIVKKLNHYNLTCRWLVARAQQKDLENALDSAQYLNDQAMEMALKEDTSQQILLITKIEKGILFGRQKHYDSALKYGLESYYLAKKVDTTQIPQVCYRIYEAGMNVRDLSIMRKFLFEGYEKAIDPAFKTVFANGITLYYERTNQIDSAIVFFKTVEKDTSMTSDYFEAVRLANFGTLLNRSQRVSESIPYLIKASSIFNTISEKNPTVYFNIAESYNKLNQHNLSNTYLDTAFTIAERNNDRNLLKEIWEIRANNYKKLKQFDLGLAAMENAFQNFKLEIDSSLVTQARELEAQYSLRFKDEQIKSLAYTNSINKKIANQQRILIVSMVIGIILIGIILSLLWRRRKTQLILKEADLKQQVLRTQMEPHFIFNSLGVLQSFLRDKGEEKPITYLNSFSRLLKQILDNTSENMVLLANEVEALQNYLHLQSVNFPNKFDYSIVIYETYLQDEMRVPPMLLQPFVENAILHGFSTINYKGHITVNIQKKSGSLRCIIEDNGIGLHEGKPGEAKRSRSTEITKERLSILSKQSGKAATLIIIDKQATGQGNGVKVILEIPVK